MAALTEAQASGGDTAAAKERVAAAQAELDAAVAAEAQAAAPTPEEAPAEPAPAEEPAAPAEEPAPQAEEPAAPAEEPAAPAEEPAAPAEEPAAPAEEPAAEAEAEAEAEADVQTEVEATAGSDAAPEADANANAEVEASGSATTEAETAPAEQSAPAEAEGGQDDATPPPPADTGAAPAAETEAQAESDSSAETSGEAAPAQSEAQQDENAEAAARASAESDTQVTPEAVLPVEGGAPVLDSAKEEPAADADADAQASGEQPAEQEAQAEAQAEAAPAPQSDAEAQAAMANEPVEAPDPLAEEGRRLDADPDRRRRNRPDDAEVITESENRVVIQFNNQIIVRGDDDRRLRDRAEDVYYEELPRGRTREVIVRPNGVQVVTIYNRHGEIIQRTRIMPNGREILLVYVPEDDRDGRRPWRDPGRDLPPLRLTIPIGEYVLDATVAEPGDYYEFLEEPPVERVERLYTVDEVKYSARIRDKVRRIDMDTLTFATGSAQIPRDQVDELGNVAEAMDRILQDNPAETFLIEGHTDAVGSEESNLILSDERAESVAIALTSVYGIPPENLATQGYGERYLKIRTEGPERLNRRVTIRRITPLVTPVASR
ncbi:OmpA family protein [Pseudohoeflea sp. DP4N28-3]|uniref:OmpA family protein n=2 Tax=Pseudohoeflea coraliihabitans TaxID=2860393 RepID=A0ABS6WSL8_9HYPH|nr:OmpA family protein [Pseudohoeflea sp. DP4N28-3]